LVVYPLPKLGDNSGLFLHVVIVDALDECDNDSNIRIIV
jgi:hypothetical protein